MKPRLRCSHWHPHGGRDRRNVEVLLVPEHDQGAIPRLEAVHQPIDFVLFGNPSRRVADWLSLMTERLDRCSSAPTTVDLYRGGDEHPPKPRRPAVRITQPRQMSPGVEEGILEGVLRVNAVPKDGVGQSVSLLALQSDQLSEGELVARTRSLDQAGSAALHTPIDGGGASIRCTGLEARRSWLRHCGTKRVSSLDARRTVRGRGPAPMQERSVRMFG